MSTTTFNSSLIGRLGNSNTDYGTCHDAANGNNKDVGYGAYVGQRLLPFALREIWRGVVVFDTSVLPIYCTIDSAKIQIGVANLYLDTDFTLHVVNGDFSYPTLAYSDYGDLLNETTSYGSILASDMSTEDYNDIDLDAAGIAQISKTGYTKFAFRSSKDILSSDPSDDEYIRSGWQDYSIRLVVEYSETFISRIALV